jgi:hypothetical protein
MTIRRACIGFAVAFAGFVLLMATTSVAASSTNPGALLARVQHAYLRVPGIELTSARGGQRRRFLLRLKNGSVTGEEFIGPGRSGVRLVARRGGSTFMRSAGRACWRRLHDSNPKWVLANPGNPMPRLNKSDPRTLLNVGGPFPDHGKVLVRHWSGVRRLLIETHGAFWFLAGNVVPSHIARKSFLTIAPNPSTRRISSIGVTAPEPSVHATLSVRALRAAPSIPRPAPVCS